MILTAHQPAYLPWLGLLHKIALSDVYVFLDNVQFEKNSFTNRNKIKTAQGALWLTVPVLSKGHFQKPFAEIEIDNSRDWRKKHWSTIELNYKKAPYFERYKDFFEEVYRKEWKLLAELTDYTLKWFLRTLGIEVEYLKGCGLGLSRSKSDMVLELCLKLKADLYVSGALGADYLEREKFEKQGVKIYFQNYSHPVYHQSLGDFLPHMSIIDLLFNCGSESLEVLMRGNISRPDLINKYEPKR